MNLRTPLTSWIGNLRPWFNRACRPRWPRTAISAVTSPAPQALPLPAALATRLETLRRRHRFAALAGAVALTLGLVATVVLVQGLADWWFGLPWLLRAALLVVDLGALAWIYVRLLRPPLSLPLTLVDVTRLIEMRHPRLGQSLLTAAELAEGGPLTLHGSPQLAARVLADAQRQSASLDLSTVVPLRRVRMAMAAASLALLVTLTVAILGGESSVALFQRILLLPAPRPTKTVVIPVTRHLVVATGEEVTLSARAGRLHPHEGRVELSLPNDAARGYALPAVETQPRLYVAIVPGARQSFQYHFVLGDARGDTYAVTVKDPPAVIALACEAIPPAYTQLPRTPLDPEAAELLAGSQLVIHATASSPLRSATVVLRGVEGTIPATLDATRTRIEATVPIPVTDLDGWSLHLIDEDGIASRNDTVHPITILPDHPPEISWRRPRARRLTITLRARPEWTVKATDDFGLAAVTLYLKPFPLEDSEETPQLLKTQPEPFALQPAPADHLYRQTLDFSRGSWEVGRIIEYWTEAKDNNNVTGPGMSMTRRQWLRILSPEEKTAELYARNRAQAAAVNKLADRHARATNETEEAVLREAPPPIPPPSTP